MLTQVFFELSKKVSIILLGVEHSLVPDRSIVDMVQIVCFLTYGCNSQRLR